MSAIRMLLCCLALAACAAVPRPELALHDFGAAPDALRPMARPAPLLLEVAMPGWLDGGGIEYRLAYAESGRLREYAWARWAAAPSRLIERRLVARAAYGTTGRTRAGCVLRLEIGEFSQVFATPQQSRGVLQGRAVLLDPARRQLAERGFALAEAAPTADAGGGVAALAAAVDALAAELLTWEASWPAGACQVSR